jgi:murein DD-endopeptidase MepM/ murein hydrolase activator NlpD
MTFIQFLKSLKSHPLIDASLANNACIPLDLSIYNPELKAVNLSSSDDLERFISDHMKKHKAKVAYGGYLERRGIYERSTYFNQANPETERNIHLGLDLWIAADTTIYAPLKGTIHSFKNNSNYGDYGPTIILKHQINDKTFYTLYGHLSLTSISNLKVGLEMKQGDKIGTLGSSEVNGDYPPHLHFQIIRDIQDYNGDYPGVTNKRDLAFYSNNCPDPKFLLNLC